MSEWTNILRQRWFWEEAGLTAIVLAAAWVAARIWILLVDKVFIRWASRTSSALDDRILKAVRRPGYLLVLLLVIVLAFAPLFPWKVTPASAPPGLGWSASSRTPA